MLLKPIPNIPTRGASALPIIPRAACLGAETARHAFGDVARSWMLRAIVARPAVHRLEIAF